MNNTDIELLLLKGEDSTTEFKEKISSDRNLAVILTSFANTFGGKLLIGITSDKKSHGVEQPDKIISKVNEVCNKLISPKLSVQTVISEFRGRKIVIVDVPKSNLAPHSTFGEYFMRKGSFSHSVPTKAIEELIFNLAKTSSDPVANLKNQISQLLQQNSELLQKFKESQSWKVKILEMTISALIGVLIGAILSMFIH